jgi:hypothetical protein
MLFVDEVPPGDAWPVQRYASARIGVRQGLDRVF